MLLLLLVGLYARTGLVGGQSAPAPASGFDRLSDVQELLNTHIAAYYR